MDITLNTAVSGMQVSQARLNVTAHNIANVNTAGFQEMTAQQTEDSPSGVRISGYTRTPNPDASNSGTDLATQMTNLDIDKSSFTADTKVFKVQNEMIGTVIDMVA